jgi:hypothetical protein
MLRNLLNAGLALVIAGGLGGCESATDMQARRQLELVNPEIGVMGARRTLAVQPRQIGVCSEEGWCTPGTGLIEGYPVLPGTLWVGAARPQNAQVAADTRIEVTARTSHGDAERFSLRAPEGECAVFGAGVSCFRIVVHVGTIEQAYALADRLPGIGGSFLGILRLPVNTAWPEEYVEVAIAIPDASWDGAMRQARRWPNVQRVTYSYFMYARAEARWPGYTGGLPVEFAEPIAGDGILQLEPGVEITLEYRQPDGSVLVSTLECCD